MENKKNTSDDIYFFTKIVLQTFVSAYLHKLDVKSAVYDKFIVNPDELTKELLYVAISRPTQRLIIAEKE